MAEISNETIWNELQALRHLVVQSWRDLVETRISEGEKKNCRDGSQRLGYCRWSKKESADTWSVNYIGSDGEKTFGKNVGCIFPSAEVAKRFSEKLNEVIDDVVVSKERT